MTSENDAAEHEIAAGAPAQLAIGENVVLKLTEDGLVIIDSSLRHAEEPDTFFSTLRRCLPSKPRPSSVNTTISYYHILWASLDGDVFSLDYCRRTSKAAIAVTSQSFSGTNLHIPTVELWIKDLLNRSYGASQQRKRIKVLVNPFGGQGNAEKRYAKDIEPIFKAARCKLDVQVTMNQGHGMAVAEKLDLDAWDVVACCSGDGVPYEVFNGLARQKEARRALATVAVVQLPCGSGNAMSWNLNGTDSPSLAALAVVKGIRMPLDLISITQGNRRTLSFLSQSLGIIAESDLATENLRWLGETRFTVGYVMRLIGKTVWPCDIAIGVESEDKDAMKREYHRISAPPSSLKGDTHTSSSSSENGEIEQGLPALQFGTVNDPLPSGWNMSPYLNLGNFYAGNMQHMSGDATVFSVAVPNDGLLDLMCIDGDIPGLRALQLAEDSGKGKLFDQPEVKYRKVVGYRIIPHKKEGYISIDGERVPFEGFQAEVHKGLGCVLSKNGRLYEARGVQLKT